MTIYSVRNDLGQEMGWTTGRKAAAQVAEKMTAAWEQNGKPRGQYGPYIVYKCSVSRRRIAVDSSADVAKVG